MNGMVAQIRTGRETEPRGFSIMNRKTWDIERRKGVKLCLNLDSVRILLGRYSQFQLIIKKN
ncbi:hypothetical protein PUN28_001159 [Cardiocondyla obscurior]|uniref:Uncharacterized protein n=1 Tax=Cardiocondyla obscurior TaxID=286306 RepID=A0AAW2H3I4_9HYME